MTTTASLRTLLALGAATLLLTGCSGQDDAERAGAPADGQRPGAQQIDEPPGSATLFGGDGVPTTPGADEATPTDPAPADVDLDAFPLDAGWPDEPVFEDQGLEMPVDEVSSPFGDGFCSSPAPTPDTTQALRAEFSDVEYYVSRELLVFADADAAVAYASELDDFYASDTCTAQETGAGQTYPLFRVDTGVGGQSFAIGQGIAVDGEPRFSLSELHVVRVGRSVLLDQASSEGVLASDADAREVADSMIEESTEVVAAQCAFTAPGC